MLPAMTLPYRLTTDRLRACCTSDCGGPPMMGEDERVVRDVWRQLDGDLATIDELLTRYGQAHRRYHTMAHIAWVLRSIDDLLADVEAATPGRPDLASSRRTLQMAAIFHDAIYDPHVGDNEQRSADLARAACLRLEWTATEAGEVQRLIMATAHHRCDQGDSAAAVLLDADLAVLGADPGVYAAYVSGVRFEYAHVDEVGWRRGRAAVLAGLLERDHIYATTLMRDRAEQQARRNIGAELAALQPTNSSR